MSGITSLIILILSMLILAFLQVLPGIFTIFYHFSRGKNSQKRADNFALDFILGVEFFYFAMWLLTYTIVFALFVNTNISTILLWTLAGIFFALSIVSFFFYYKKAKKSSATFVPRRIVRGILSRSELAKSRLDALLLGFFAGVPELLFTLPIFFIVTLVLQTSVTFPHSLIIILSIILCITPLFIIRHFYQINYTLADISRFRIKIKPYVRLFLTLSFLALAILTILYGVNDGQ